VNFYRQHLNSLPNWQLKSKEALVPKPQQEAEQGIYVLYCPAKLPVPRMGSSTSQDPVRQSGECLILEWTFLDSLTVSCSVVVSLCIIAYQTCAYMYVSLRWIKGSGIMKIFFLNIFIKASGRWWEEEAEFTQVLFWDRSHSPCKLATAWPRSLSNSERTISESRGGASHCVGLCQAKQ
jgi:hypothetical protein